MCKIIVVTARKRSLGQGNIFAPVCHSVHRGKGIPACLAGHMTPRETPRQGDPLPRRPPCQRPPAKKTPAKKTPLPRRPLPRRPQPRRPPCQGDPPAKETPHQGDPPAKETPRQGDPLPRRPPCQGDPPAKETHLPPIFFSIYFFFLHFFFLFPPSFSTFLINYFIICLPPPCQCAGGTHPIGMHSC